MINVNERKKLEEAGMIYQEKPPIGVKPGWLHSMQRIRELADAINRNVYGCDNISVNSCLMRIWAEEIILQLDIMEMSADGLVSYKKTDEGKMCTEKCKGCEYLNPKMFYCEKYLRGIETAIHLCGVKK